VLETNLDHLSAEHLAYACGRLMDAGALDVWQTPIVMKKGRAAVTLSVMTAPEDARRFSALVIELTGALGVRRTLTERDVVPRRVETVKTSLGAVRVKVAFIAGKARVRPEHDDVAAIAAREGLPYDEVARTIVAEVEAIVRW
jgi:pyridinium-3,5-bisthiocarboxylic acid mononucleotide nickel chelatase